MKNFYLPTALLLLALLIFPSCQTSKVDIQAEKDTILSLERIWVEDIQNKNVESFQNLLASDAVFMIDDIPILDGKDAILEAQSSWYGDTTIDFSTFQTEIVDVQVSQSGDMAFDRGSEHYMQATPEGMVERWNKFIDIWKKADGEWKVVVVIGNSDNP